MADLFKRSIIQLNITSDFAIPDKLTPYFKSPYMCLHQFTNLTDLTIWKREREIPEELSCLSKIKYLSINCNPIGSLNRLDNLNLEYLSFEDNPGVCSEQLSKIGLHEVRFIRIKGWYKNPNCEIARSEFIKYNHNCTCSACNNKKSKGDKIEASAYSGPPFLCSRN